MRREKILNVSMNHRVSQEILSLFRRKDDKSWTWAARDFSDGLLGRESDCFALKFKTAEISEDFKGALDSAVNSPSIISEEDIDPDGET